MLTEQFKIQKNEIQTIIEDANRASMAGAFRNQADDINKKMKWADGILITSLVISSLISLWGFSTSYNTGNFDWVQFISKISITIPFILIAGIKAREREYLFRIREDYAYKYSSAMAFEGYKKQIQEQDPELQQQLLQIALNNLGEKPTRVFEKEISATPAENLIDIISKRLDNSMNNKSKEIPNKNKELIDD